MGFRCISGENTHTHTHKIQSISKSYSSKIKYLFFDLNSLRPGEKKCYICKNTRNDYSNTNIIIQLQNNDVIIFFCVQFDALIICIEDSVFVNINGSYIILTKMNRKNYNSL